MGREDFTKIALDNPEALSEDEVVPVYKEVNEMVETLVKAARAIGVDQHVECDQHWRLMGKIISMWEIVYDKESKEFYTGIQRLKKQQMNDHASSREKGGAEIRHLMEMHPKLLNLIMTIFPGLPEQMRKKKFAREFVRHFPKFRIAHKV